MKLDYLQMTSYLHQGHCPIKLPNDHRILHKDLSTLTKCADDWKMEFNILKCKIMQVRHSITFVLVGVINNYKEFFSNICRFF